jgi:hypothetical protein
VKNGNRSRGIDHAFYQENDRELLLYVSFKTRGYLPLFRSRLKRMLRKLIAKLQGKGHAWLPVSGSIVM